MQIDRVSVINTSESGSGLWFHSNTAIQDILHPDTHDLENPGERTITPDFGIDLGGSLGESRFPL